MLYQSSISSKKWKPSKKKRKIRDRRKHLEFFTQNIKEKTEMKIEDNTYGGQKQTQYADT